MRQSVLHHALVCLVLVSACASASAQNAALHRTVIQKGDVAAPEREAVVAKVEIDKGGSAGRHTHPGDEISYVTEGEGEIIIDGEDPRRLKPGDAFVVPAGKIHDARNVGAGPLKLVGVYVVDKGKPLATPAK